MKNIIGSIIFLVVKYYGIILISSTIIILLILLLSFFAYIKAFYNTPAGKAIKIKMPGREQYAAVKEKADTVKKIFLRVPDMNCKQYQKALNLVDIFEGTVQVIFYNTAENKYVSYSNGISLSSFVLTELRNVLGEENVVIK
jgi:hypothetical protein